MEEFICQKCGKQFDKAKALAGHLAKCGKVNQTIICPICGKICIGKQALASHTTFKHNSSYNNSNNQIKENLYCKYCAKQCKNNNSLNQHEIRCQYNPKRINVINQNFNSVGRDAWNKGLTKETDSRVAQCSNSLRQFNFEHPDYKTATDENRLYNSENQLEIQKWINYTKTVNIEFTDYKRSVDQDYVQICINGKVDLEHRYLIRLYTGADNFVVHHLDENKINNNIENLIGFKTVADHVRYHYNKNCKLVYDEQEHLFETIVPE